MKTPTRERASLGELVLLATGGSLLAVACSSGLEGGGGNGTAGLQETVESTNGRFGFDPCVVLTDPITEIEVAGGVIPTATGSRERPVAFVAFVTRSAITDVDDGTTDGNSVEDVLVAAVDCDSVDPRAFAHSIAGTMRHTRCVTCHQMNIDVVADPSALPPTPFLTQDHFEGGGGAPPMGEFGDSTCKDCHFEDWLAPGPTFDLRRSGTRDLFLRAQVPPGGLTEHFSTDPRVIWALDSGLTPFGNVADDDHDGIDEPEDHDGVRRRAPGGKASFLERLQGWLDTEDPVTGELKYSSAEDALQDIVVASRQSGANAAANGASSSPSLVFEPNPGFDPMNPPAAAAGFLHVAFQSNATNLVGGTGNGFTDIFRVTIDVFVTAAGTIDLDYRNGSQLHVSRAFGGGDSKGNSTDPHIGADGERIAFVSEAFDLVAGLPPTCRPEVYLWDEFLATPLLVSHVPGNPLQPGDDGAINPDLSLDGLAVSFESDATDLVPGDMNGTRDVFYALWPALDVERASVTSMAGEFSGHATGASVSHVGNRVKVAFAVQDTALAPTVAVQCPDEIVLISVDRDTSIWEDDPAMNQDGSHLFVGQTGGGNRRRALMGFPIDAFVPAGATINEVSLSMVVNLQAGDPAQGAGACSGSYPLPADFELHEMNADWVENVATWNNTEGNQNPAASATVFNLDTEGAVVWSSTPTLVAEVQGWLDTPASNFGWMLEGEDVNCSAKRFDSQDTGTAPLLTIDYTPPLAPQPLIGGATLSQVYVRDAGLGTTLDLNQAMGPDGPVAAQELDVDGTALPANATRPVISRDGNAVMFETMAQNLDVVRTTDENREMDVVLVDLLQFDTQGFVLPYTLSVTADGGAANGPSHSPRFGSFNPPTDAFPLGIALYATNATNLGDTDPGDLDGDGVPEEDNFMLSFLSEGGSVIADFEAVPPRQGMGRAVTFESKSSGEPTDFVWDFGDGSPTSTQRSPRHVYATPDFYTVTLTATGERGMDDRTRIEYVHVLDAVVATFSTTKDTTLAPDQAPAVNIAFGNPIAGAIDDVDPTSVLLFDMVSDGSTEFPDDFRWTLQRVDTGGNPMGPNFLVSQEANPEDVPIDAVGLYDLTLEATGPGGAGMATQRLEVYQKVDASFTTNPAGSPVRGSAPLMVQFTDTSTGDILDANAHLYDFGDGGTSTVADPMHTFNEGVYFVTLNVVGKGTDLSMTTTVPVIADGVITSVFSINPQPNGSLSGLLAGEVLDPGAGALVDFTTASQEENGAPLFYRWDFGVGLTGQETVANPVGISYTADPENVIQYDVELVTSTIDPAPVDCLGAPPGTCAESLMGTLTVYPPLLPDFFPPGPSVSSSLLRPPHTVQFAADVTGDGFGTDPEYRWLRSEPNQPGATIEFATGPVVFHEFDDAGQYEVVLEVTTNAPGGARQTVQSAPRDVTVSASTLTEFVVQAIQDPASRCTNCHSGATPPAGLIWTGTPTEIHQRIVGIASNNCTTGRNLVEPGDAENSVVYNVLLDPSGPLCPINMRVNLPGDEADKDAHVAVLRSWISDGAPDN